MPSEENQRIEALLKAIPKGRVATYGGIALRAGLRNGARQVVRLLHARSEKADLPWFRVLRKDGSIALAEGGGFELQRQLLEAEGVSVSREGRVDLETYGWK
jgi:methylated-DNA-protein-cysteine methyltransferase-like protein